MDSFSPDPFIKEFIKEPGWQGSRAVCIHRFEGEGKWRNGHVNHHPISSVRVLGTPYGVRVRTALPNATGVYSGLTCQARSGSLVVGI